MTFNDAKEKFNTIISDVAGHADDAVLFLDELEKDYGGAAAVSDELATAKERIAELETVNQKLYLSVTNEVEDVPDEIEEKTGMDAIEEFWDEVDREEKSEL